jgi:hypothetical protein
MGTTTFSGPVVSQNGFQGNVTGDVNGAVTSTKPLILPTSTVAGVPSAADNTNGIIIVTDANSGAELDRC